nr:serine/threonine-protein kinase [Mycolicibacter sinensis]
MPLADGTRFAGFTVLRMLGSGGMGEVYLARHPRLSRNDALKVLPRDLADDPAYRRRFEREADAAAGLFHPNIVGVHDRGECNGQLWISMDFVEGFDALKLLRETLPGGLPHNEVVQIAQAVADALDYAHSRGLLHRDVKPANILIAGRASGHRRIMLGDFGIARRIDDTSGLTATNMTLGTLNYSAPEQLTGQAIDGRADQYALAATVFHLFTGSAPYAHSNPAVVISRRLSEPPPRLSYARPDLAGLDPVLARGLATEPNDRFASCAEFAAALTGQRAAVASAPTLVAPAPAARAESAAEPLTLPAGPTALGRRPRPPVWALAFLGVMTAVAAVLGGMLLVRNGQPAPVAAQTRSPTYTAPDAPSIPATRAATPPVGSPTRSTAPARSSPILPDADEYGFVSYHGGARCAGTDRAVMILRTTQSAVVICRGTAEGLYYRGYRISDGATIELGDVVPVGSGYRAINGSEDAFYEVTTRGLVIAQHGQILADEPAVESAS